jgi:hypothetical protein
MSQRLLVLVSAANVVLALSIAPAVALSPTAGTSALAGARADYRIEIQAPKGVQPGETKTVEEQLPSPESGTGRTGIDRFAQCISFWDPGTHMTRDEWRESCKRVNHDHNATVGSE